MKKSLILLALALASVLPARAAEMKQIPVVRLEAVTEVAAAPQAVWNYMISGKNLVTWCPEWKNPANAKINLKKVGDVLDFTDAWGNGGHSIVTFLSPGKELRVAHEPNDGSYVCQARILLTPAGSGTQVRFIEQYTDESSPDDLKATAAKTDAEITATLEALKTAVEKK
jgi:hypothetical protein